MQKYTNQVLGRPNATPADLGLLKIEICPPLQDITHAALLPNYRLEVASNTTHERGTVFLRVFDSKYDSDLHDAEQLHKDVGLVLEDICHGQVDKYRLVASQALQFFDRGLMAAPYQNRGDWSPSQHELFKYSASAILSKVNARPNPMHGGYHVIRSSTIAFEPNAKTGDTYRFDLLLEGDLRFYAVPKTHAAYNVVPMPYMMGADMNPADRESVVRNAGAVQGEFTFQGVDYAFAFIHSMFTESIAGVFSKHLLGAALEAAIRSQFPFFMPPRGAEVGVKLLNIKFK